MKTLSEALFSRKNLNNNWILESDESYLIRTITGLKYDIFTIILDSDLVDEVSENEKGISILCIKPGDELSASLDFDEMGDWINRKLSLKELISHRIPTSFLKYTFSPDEVYLISDYKDAKLVIYKDLILKDYDNLILSTQKLKRVQ